MEIVHATYKHKTVHFTPGLAWSCPEAAAFHPTDHSPGATAGPIRGYQGLGFRDSRE
jgi:hypothetical protein